MAATISNMSDVLKAALERGPQERSPFQKLWDFAVVFREVEAIDDGPRAYYVVDGTLEKLKVRRPDYSTVEIDVAELAIQSHCATDFEYAVRRAVGAPT